jgi:outer membrane lipopolysaccharide assembly protein LptE/RlpB
MLYKGLLVCVVGLGLLTVSSAARNESGPEQQDVIRLETRMNQLEQRLYSIDSNVRSLEQQLRLAGQTSRGGGGEDVVRLRLELQALQQRVAEHECALAKLDERTLSAAMRAARRKSGSGANDPCRLNVDTPVQLSSTRDD